jgi:hypothetical protein
MTLATQTPVTIAKDAFHTMLNFAMTVYQQKQNDAYLAAMQKNLPETGLKNTANPSILMGYDFHLTDEGPKLIEINNNAGGLFEKDDGWIKQDSLPEMKTTLLERICAMFPQDWQHIAIMDENIAQQYMYPEMQAYAALLKSDGRAVKLVSPEDIKSNVEGLFVENDNIDMIYNRHTDFYLETPELAHIRQAFMAKKVDINPYPRSYALIGHKNRMVDWWREGVLEACVDAEDLNLIRAVVPETHILAEYDLAQAWAERKQWVFKPAARHGGKGVLLGKAMSRKRFNALEPASTVMQKLVPPSQIELDDKMFKFDVRLYMHGANLIAMAGRAWNGQITNFREEGSGWTPIRVQS